MTKHKIVAYKITGKRDGLTITAMTESPRGTRIPFEQVKLSSEGKDKEAMRSEIEQAVTAMQNAAL